MSNDPLDQFVDERQRLTALAYRMLGERAAAEDVVQEAWVRWSRAARTDVKNPAAWLHRVTTRLAIDALRSARHRREIYVGPWLPEPLVSDVAQSSEDDFAVAQECQLALLWAMERLTPEERAAFILRQVFDTDYTELADILDRSEAACRKLVSRASRKLKSDRSEFRPDPSGTANVLTGFAQAVLAQDRDRVLAFLAPDVVSLSDGGGKVRSVLRPLVGAEEVAHVTLAVAANYPVSGAMKVVWANSSPALAVLEGGPGDMVYSVTINADGLIDWIYMMRNPDKLPLH